MPIKKYQRGGRPKGGSKKPVPKGTVPKIPKINPRVVSKDKGLWEKVKNVLGEAKYQVFDKGTIRDWKWQRDNPEGFHWNMIRKGRDYDGGNTRKKHGGPVYNHKGMKVPGMRKGR